MSKNNHQLILILSLFWMLACAFFFGPVSWVGWYIDAVFLATASLLLYGFSYALEAWKKRTIKLLSLISIFCVIWSTLTAFPVKRVPSKTSQDEYGYFISRGNTGATSGCFGQVQYFKPWHPEVFLEIKTTKIECSRMPYSCYLEDC